MSGTAYASTCPVGSTSSSSGDYISLSVVATTCSSKNGNDETSPLNGYVTLVSDIFSPEVTSGSFSVPTGYSSLELIIRSDTSIPHPDQFIIILPWVASFTWDFDNNSVVTGKSRHTDAVSSAVLFGLPTIDPSPTPLPAALPLFAGGAGLIGLLARRRKQKAALAAA